MKYLEPSFSTLPPAGAAYRDNHDRIFGKKDAEQPLPEDAHLKDESAQGTALCDPSEQLVDVARRIVRYGCLNFPSKGLEDEIIDILARMGVPYVG